MLNKSSSLPYLFRFSNLNTEKRVTHFISGKSGGVSMGPCSSLNLGFNTEDLPENVLLNRRILAENLGIHPHQFVFARQAHTGTIALIEQAHSGMGFENPDSAIPDTDAMVTNVPGVCLIVLVADCVPVIFYDPVKHVAAVAHAGWRGTLKEISRLTIQTMRSQYDCLPSDILCGIGPSIGPCCYEVGEEVIQAGASLPFNTKGYLRESETAGKAVFDLWAANRIQLLEAGLKEEHIEISCQCTKCNADTWFSSRAGKGNTGRFAAGICLA